MSRVSSEKAIADTSRAKRVGVLAGAMLTSMLGACDVFTGPGDEPVMGVIQIIPEANGSVVDPSDPDDCCSVRIQAPDTVAVGAPFVVEITTYGSDGCWTADHVEIVNGPLSAQITPFDHDNHQPETTCPDWVQVLSHQAQVTFTEPGDAVLEVTGRIIREQSQDDVRSTVTRAIHVR